MDGRIIQVLIGVSLAAAFYLDLRLFGATHSGFGLYAVAALNAALYLRPRMVAGVVALSVLLVSTTAYLHGATLGAWLMSVATLSLFGWLALRVASARTAAGCLPVAGTPQQFSGSLC